MNKLYTFFYLQQWSHLTDAFYSLCLKNYESYKIAKNWEVGPTAMHYSVFLLYAKIFNIKKASDLEKLSKSGQDGSYSFNFSAGTF